MAQLFKPRFLDQQDQGSGMYKPLFNFRRLWKQSIAAMLAVALLLPVRPWRWWTT